MLSSTTIVLHGGLIHVRICVCIYVYVYVYTYMCMCMCIRIYVCVYVYMYVYMYICMCSEHDIIIWKLAAFACGNVGCVLSTASILPCSSVLPVQEEAASSFGGV